MDTKDVKSAIYEILHNMFHISDSLLMSSYDDAPLTGKVFKLNSISMVYLFFEIEKTFDIKIDENYLANYSFSNINGIVDAVEHILSNVVNQA